MIDWKNPDCLVTEHFSVKDCLWQHMWGRLASVDEDGVLLTRLIALCEVCEQVRTLLGGCPMNVHSMFRSLTYNRAQNINPVNDVHSQSWAVDFDCHPHLTIDEVKERLRPELERLKIRMEKKTSTWVHIDMKLPGPSGREFVA